MARWHSLAAPALSAAIGLVVASAASAATGGPTPPCGQDPIPPYGDTGAAPAVVQWPEGELPLGWIPPACLAWEGTEREPVVALAGRFIEPGGLPAIMARLAPVANLTEIRFPATDERASRPLAAEVQPLARPERTARRADFTPDDMVPGAEQYLWLRRDAESAAGILSRRVLLREADRIVVVEQAVAESGMAAPEARPGSDWQSWLRIAVEAGDDSTWSYYFIARGGPAGEAEAMGRAAALFRHIAGGADEGGPVGDAPAPGSTTPEAR